MNQSNPEPNNNCLQHTSPFSFPEWTSFKFPWRSYQQRVLDELNTHLDDQHLHIVAPPGSGKTVLGLEVVLRLNKPTLILAPTIAIRNQWINRFCELFLGCKERPDWISVDVRDPGFLTVSTYQALHAAITGENEPDFDEEEQYEVLSNGEDAKGEEEQSVILSLKKAGVKVLVVDEAHHLKNAWWKTLDRVKLELDPIVVGLTATPPYDVTGLEWERYIELNGPVDAEITIPELVGEGDLCPHQDYVYFSLPTSSELEKINSYRNRMQKLRYEIFSDDQLINALQSHPVYAVPGEKLEWIYTNLEFYSAILIFMNYQGFPPTAYHREVIGDKSLEIPLLNDEWLELLLVFYLFHDERQDPVLIEHRETLSRKLKHHGILKHRRVKFSVDEKLVGYLSRSRSKLESVSEITNFEYDSMGRDLRMVILTDYIRSEFLSEAPVNDLPLEKMGVVPVFEKLRRDHHNAIKLGVLCGSLVILPVSAIASFEFLARSYGIDALTFDPLPYDNSYCVLALNDGVRHSVVNLVTQIFQQGQIEVLVGTKSLLGEGWDAPAINSLIMASTVGSFVMSNQMRGRAIRTDLKAPYKVSNIWHLVCLDPEKRDGGEDFKMLNRRFKTFSGVSDDGNCRIENGIGRLGITTEGIDLEAIPDLNKRTLSNAGDRTRLAKSWDIGLKGGVRMVEEIKVPFRDEESYGAVTSFYFRKTIKYVAWTTGSALFAFVADALQVIRKFSGLMRSQFELSILFWIAGGFATLLFGRATLKSLIMFLKYRDISRDFNAIGIALKETLVQTGAISSPPSSLEVVTQSDGNGVIFCNLKGGTTYEKSLFVDAMQEILDGVRNPRYVIIRKSSFFELYGQEDFHAVPESIGSHKRKAEIFRKEWVKNVGRCNLIYTRNLEGRKILLKARFKALSSEFLHRTERINSWKM
ncbi:DEAD/DEAH box helicase family protein [Robertkochia solimangrovi]|uniref:DEAD/DEAH box helicase family protein n=1 Tax=Robertkochia solimangrovi TaxID=2213046 RepID=UPI00117DCC9B|nr:DEAD/DEAH box helicase family protein [Robertkochia solimangrovi]TRZ41384.1 restriction endonuclease subunit R [Robertkochia solimangrovi]